MSSNIQLWNVVACTELNFYELMYYQVKL